MTNKVEDIIKKLDLLPHPEGGYYKEIYRSTEKISPRGLPPRYSSERTFSTSIYYLLKSGQFSSFHKIQSDETWHFYLGSPIIVHILFPDGNYKKVVMGNDIVSEQLLQFTVLKDTWFAAEPIELNSFSLIGCTVAPGFEFDDFKLGRLEYLVNQYTDYSKLIERLTSK